MAHSNSNSSHATLMQANEAFAQGLSRKGLTLLREYNRDNLEDAASWHRQATIEEQIGDISEAGKAHSRCIEIAPNNALGYLYGGYLLQTLRHFKAAASLYSIAFELDPNSLDLWQHSTVSAPTQQRSRAANELMREVFSQHHVDKLSNLNDCQRIVDAQWRQTSTRPISFSTADYGPELFYISGIKEQAFYSSRDFDWCRTFCARRDSITQELKLALDTELGKNNLRPYLDGEFSNHSSLKSLANTSKWQAIDIFRNGEKNEKIVDLFPHTLDALSSVPTYGLSDQPFECFFSLLEPHELIAPHFGQSNHALTVHLPIDIPDNCYMKVAGQQRSWNDDQLMIFDDSFLHSAHNDSNECRIVLIFSVWHPDLSIAERNAVLKAFEARRELLKNRYRKLEKLKSL